MRWRKRGVGAVSLLGAALALALAMACSHEASSVPPATTGDASAPGCAPWETPAPDGSCIPPGVPASRCGAGFRADGKQGCEAILPSAACQAGEMAVPGDTACRAVGALEPPTCARGLVALPGDTACRDVADCGAAPWGSIPVEATTHFVDASFAGASDGSAQRPWKTLGAALTAASAGAIVAVAAGRYAERVVLGAKAVRLWGRCPSMVEIVASGVGAGITIAGASAALVEVHQLAVSGDGQGISVAASSDGARVDRMWLHDLTRTGVVARSTVSITESLIESTHDAGVDSSGGVITIDSSVVRSVLPHADGSAGEGVIASAGARAVLSNVLVEACHFAGVYARDADLSIAGSVVRDVQLEASSTSFARGVQISATLATMRALALQGSLVTRSAGAGVLALGNVTATIESCAIRDTRTDAKGSLGIGVFADIGSWTSSPVVTLRGSLIEGSHRDGVYGLGAALTVERTVVRDTVGEAQSGGAAVHAATASSVGVRGHVAVRGSLLERSAEAELFVEASDADVEATLMRDTSPPSSRPVLGYGVLADTSASGGAPSLAMRSSVVSGQRGAGILLHGGTAVVEASVVRDVVSVPFGSGFGRGIEVEAIAQSSARPSLVLRASLVEACREAGLRVEAADLVIEDSAVRGTLAATGAGGGFGDGLDVVRAGDVRVTRTRFASNARAGLAAFGSRVALAAANLACNAIALDGESDDAGVPASFDLGAGGNDCGCGDGVTCQVLGANLSPPAPIAP